MSFNDILESIDFNDCFNRMSKVLDSDVINTLHAVQSSIDDFLILISDAANAKLENIALLANSITTSQFGHAVSLYTPLYIANYCENACVYCGFNTACQTIRQALNSEEIENELSAIYDMGLRDVLILTGESRKHSGIDYIADAVTLASRRFKSIGIEIYPLEQEEYAGLIKSGVNSLTVYQETYHQEIYSQLHLKGPKTNFKYRLDTPERAAKAGMPQISIGALLGLSDPIYDAIALFYHLKYLEKKYPFVELSISLPRLREIGSDMHFGQCAVSDRLFTKLMMAFRICFPRLGINISTRESSSLRRHLLPLGVTKMSAGVVTHVGGHSTDVASESQFSISDHSSVKDVVAMLKDSGYQAIYSDWVKL